MTGSIPQEQYAAFRSPEPADNGSGRGSVDVLTFDTARAETEHVADLLRRAHLEDGIGWSEMAVLVRSGRTSIPGLRRSLAAAGVPVEVASDETPLVREPAVLPLLAALAVVVDGRHRRPGRRRLRRRRPCRGAADLTARRPRRHRRPVAHAGPARPRHRSAPARDLVRRRGARAGRPRRRSTGEPGRRARRLAKLLVAGPGRAGRRRHRRGGALGALGRHRLGAPAARGATQTGRAGRAAGPPRPRRDLRAVRGGRAGRGAEAATPACASSWTPCVAQEIPADTLADRGVRGDAVRLLTAHRSKGLEWRLVVVAHVQEGAWPDLRRRDSLLQADRIGLDGLLPPLTRARDARRGAPAVLRRVHARPAAAGRDRGAVARRRRRAAVAVRARARSPTPSTGSGRPPPAAVAGRPGRRAAPYRSPTRPSPSPCAAPRPDGSGVPCRRPRSTAARSHPAPTPPLGGGCASRAASDRPVRPADEPLTLSASALEGLLTCPAQWFLQREAGGEVVQLDQPGVRQGRARNGRADRSRRAVRLTTT